MPRPVDLGSGARLWPSAVYQTATLELAGAGTRLLVDPGIAPWEIEDVAGDDVGHVLLTHGDWDHVLAVGWFPQAEIVAGRRTAAYLAEPGTAAAVEREAGRLYVEIRGLDRLRVDRPLDVPCEAALGPFTASLFPTPGHTDDGVAAWCPEAGVLAAGDYLSALEIPFVNHSARAYRDTLRAFVDVIGRERPRHVVPGHGPPHTADAALALAAEDLAYVEALLAHADAGGEADRPDAVAFTVRNPGDADAHARNVRRACEETAAA